MSFKVCSNCFLLLKQNIDFKLEGKHSQYPGNLDSNVAMSLGKGKDVKAGITFNDRSDRLQKMIGSLKFASPIGGLDIGTDFIQTSQKQVSRRNTLFSQSFHK